MLTQQSVTSLQEATAGSLQSATAADRKYYALFFFSGIPALLYQIVWERALFAIYGINVESVTMIVSAFMLGLGLGSLAGGRLSKIPRLPLLMMFSCIEFGIAVFGFFSLKIFHFVATFTAGAPLPATGTVAFLLLLVPTLLMGSTLPLLTEHLVRHNGNVGESVGALYCVNTFGSAVACFAAAFVLMNALGQSGSVRVATAINVSVATAAFLLNFASNHRTAEAASARIDSSSRQCAAGPVRELIQPHVGAALCAAVGFVALGYEILWYRLYSFASGRSARCFAMLLGWYLAGLAYGSLAAHDFCREHGEDTDAVLRAIAIAVLLGSVIGFLIGPALSLAARVVPILLTFPLVFIAAALLGAAFPLLSHACIAPESGHTGSRLSVLYLCNILGCTLGSYTVGFIAMDHLSTRGVSTLLLLAGVAVALVVLTRVLAPFQPRHRRAAFAITAFAGVLIGISSLAYPHMYERLLYKQYSGQFGNFQHLVENRQGVIAVSNDNTVFGGGVYDGRINTDLVHDDNLIFRAYAVTALHPHPREVLIVGLSGGAWAQVIANDPAVERITIVEINPGYLKIIPLHPEVASLLHNPKVHIIIDDGRRWLVGHPERNFDFVLMNTTQHWLENASDLLSVDFLQIVRQHLKPGGVHYYNTTFSSEALRTGTTVFPYALRVGNFLAVSDGPIEFNKDRWKEELASYRIDGKPVFDFNVAGDRAAFQKLLALVDTRHSVPTTDELDLESGASLRARLHGVRMITDDNMGVEWQAR